MAFMDLGPITTVIKSALPPPPQAQPSVAEAMKPVPDTEIQAPVPPPAKGAQPGLGERMDLYDSGNPAVPGKPPAESEAELLGNGTGLPQPSVEPVHLDLPFLKPLGGPAPLGQAIDERV